MGMTSGVFLDALFGEKPDGAWIYLWKLSTKKSIWFQDVTKAGAYLEKDNADMFVGCGMVSRKGTPSTRVKAEQVKGIPGFYADIDIKHAVHKNTNLPETVKEAMSLIKGHGFDPSLVIHSGHGLQAWWLFKEPWMFDDDAEREKAAALSQRLTETLRSNAGARGWGVDGVHDLSRVLRVPGTFNNKQGDMIPVVCFEENTVRYNPDDFDELLVEMIMVPVPGSEPVKVAADPKLVEKIGGGLVLNINANPPTEKFDVLCDIDPQFKQSWQGKRKFKSGDTTTSAYHMSLAYYAVEAGWTDQEVANLLIAWNRRHGHPMDKVVGRPKYVGLTLLAAKKKITDKETAKSIELAGLLGDTETRAEKIALIKASLGFEVVSIDKYMADTVTYVLKTTTHEIPLPGVACLLRHKNLQDSIGEAIDFRIPNVSKRQWAILSQALLALVTTVAMPAEATLKGRLKYWLRDYLDGKPQFTAAEAAAEQDPFVKGGNWHIFVDSLMDYMRQKKSIEEGRSTIITALKRLGLESQKVNVVIDGAWTSRRVLLVPTKILAVPTRPLLAVVK
ncbi:MAG: hypothetical protein JEZ11_03870 [Desulfobacterales bacterium]|nr:hypothetical protein [Desulfobacterales bacterium]